MKNLIKLMLLSFAIGAVALAGGCVYTPARHYGPGWVPGHWVGYNRDVWVPGHYPERAADVPERQTLDYRRGLPTSACECRLAARRNKKGAAAAAPFSSHDDARQCLRAASISFAMRSAL